MRSSVFFSSDVSTAAADMATRLTDDFGHSDKVESLWDTIETAVHDWFSARDNDPETPQPVPSDG